MSEIPPEWNLPEAKPVKPKESASIMITNGDLSIDCKVMLGHRVTDLPAFPNYWSFPGGGISKIDREATVALDGFDEDDAAYIGILRELVEEVGWTISGRKLIVVPEKERKSVVQQKDAWFQLVKQNRIPCEIEGISQISERTTPPFAPFRFSNKFLHFHVNGEIPNAELVNGTEFDEVRWDYPRVLLQEWKENKIKIPPPIVTILIELCELLDEYRYTIKAIEEGKRKVGEIGDVWADEKKILFAHGVECIPIKTATLPPAISTNCYILGYPKGQIIIVDPAAKDSNEIKKLERRITQLIEEGHEIIATIFTHSHSDHIGDLKEISKIYSAPVWTSVETNSAIQEIHCDRILSDGDTIELKSPEGKMLLEILITPGHCPGHICLNTSAGIVSGDMVAGIGTILIPPGDGNMEEYLSQLKRLENLKPKLLFPSHGPVLSMPKKILRHYIEHRTIRQGKICNAVKEGINNVNDIAKIAYSDTPNAHPALSRQQTLSHLLSLEREGEISYNGAIWSAN